MSKLEVNAIDSVGSTLTLGDTNATTLTVNSGITSTPFAPSLSVNQWYPSNVQPTNAASTTTLTNWNVQNYTNVASIGSNVTESGGTFSFAKTGIYEIIAQLQFLEYNNNYAGYAGVKIRMTYDNNANYSDIARAYTSMEGAAGSSTYGFSRTSAIIDVTDISQQRIRIAYETATQQYIQGNSDESFIIFKRLGDT